jgi:DNA repair protein RecO (recombination protein O)
MAYAVDRTTPERERNIRLFMLLRSGLEALEAGASDPALLAYAFLAKMASATGLHPTLGVCVECGSPQRVAFSFGRGGAVCGRCVQRTDPKTRPDVLDEWSALLEAEWDALRTRANGHRGELGALVLNFVQWHTESRLRAFGVLPARS